MFSLGCENEVMVHVAQRLERGPVESRVGAFSEVFSVADRYPSCHSVSTVSKH